MRLLLAIALAAFALSTATARASVACVQSFLLETAFDPGPADGAWGKRTAVALDEFFDQLGETVDGGLGKDNVTALCALFTGPRHDELVERGAFRIYDVSIDPDAISTGSSETIFDFSHFDLSEVSMADCRFDIHRRNKQSGIVEREAIVDGRLSIESGRLVFGEHAWHSGGMADASFLIGEANLRVASSGQIIGMTPYFHMFVSPGQAPEPPMYVTFSKAFTANGEFPSGVSEFDAGGANEDGMFSLACGTPSPPQRSAFDFSAYEIATDARFEACRFSISRRYDDWPADRRPEVIADGKLDIKDGVLVFGDNQWHTGGLADDTYLRTAADLRLTTAGQVVGVTPYFHIIVNEDHPEPVAPLEVELSSDFHAVGNFPNGVSNFAVAGEGQHAALTLGLCRPAG